MRALSLTRRECFLLAASALASRAAGHRSRISAEGYIFEQYAERQKKPLKDVIGEVFPMLREAGFHNVELNPSFFAPDLRDQVLSAVRSNGLAMPSVYAGGGMHTKALAEQTTKLALQVAGICKPFGCTAVVTNADPKPGHARKTDDELAVEAESFDNLGRVLAENGFQLRVHNHTPEMADDAREWRYILQHTDPKLVSFCVDVDWVHQGGLDPLQLLREAGRRVTEIHVRNSKNNLWLEAVGPGDIDYKAVAALLKDEGAKPLIVVELAYRENTVITRPLAADLRLSRIYTERAFGLRA